MGIPIRHLVVITGLCAAVAAATTLSGCAQIGSTKEVVFTSGAPAAIGPYSQGIRQGNMLFLAGQGAIDPKTNQPMTSASIEDQTKQALENLRAVLEASGMTLGNIVSTTVYMKDLNDFTRMNAVYGTYFTDKPPARATLEAARLPRDLKIEISAIAVK